MIPVIVSGGVGSRLWPVSREQHPKPFIRLGDGQSLLQKAFLRASQLKATKAVMTVTNRATNTADARRIIRIWAQALRNGLDSLYKGGA